MEGVSKIVYAILKATVKASLKEFTDKYRQFHKGFDISDSDFEDHVDDTVARITDEIDNRCQIIMNDHIKSLVGPKK